jgi:hypothetical protein
MALSSLLDIVTRACDELVMDRPSAVVAGTSQQVRTILACAQAVGRDLMRAHHWTALQTLGTITTADGTSSYALATDYDRMLPDTAWDRTNDWMMVGPDTPQINRYLNESGVAQTSTRRRFRIAGTNLTIWPTPTSVATLVYEYVSNKWARSSGGTAQTEFAADTDTTVFDPDLFKSELKWRIQAARGMFADGLRADAREIREARIGSDLGGSKINMAPDPAAQFIELDNLADASWDL